MRLDDKRSAAKRKTATGGKQWSVPELVDLDEDSADILNAGGPASDGGGRTTS